MLSLEDSIMPFVGCMMAVYKDLQIWIGDDGFS